MTDVIDLDALAPKSITVRMGGEDIKLDPPSLVDVMRLADISQRMASVSAEDMEGASKAIEELTEQIYKCAPALKGKSLNTAQLLKLVTIITDAATPPDVKELEEQGVAPGNPDTPKGPVA